MKSILGIINHPPTGSSRSHEAIEMLMVYAAFGFSVSILFRGSGVMHLQNQQQPDVFGLKDHSAILAAMDLYDIENLLVDKKAFDDYQCQAATNIHFELIDDTVMRNLISRADEVLNF